MLENGSVQRHETGQRDPAIVLFDSYAFDLSRLSNAPQNIKYSVRERYLWELYGRSPATRCSPTSRARSAPSFTIGITAPLYPLAFVVVTFAYLGAPRTTRQSRTVSLLAAIGVVAALRAIGFIAMVAGVHTPIALVLPYLALTGAFVLGYLGISRGIIIEPPAFIANPINTTHGTPRAARRRPMGQTS